MTAGWVVPVCSLQPPQGISGCVEGLGPCFVSFLAVSCVNSGGALCGIFCVSLFLDGVWEAG